MSNLAELATSMDVGPMVLAPPVAGIIYGLLVWDARRPNSPNASDDQLGVKTVVDSLLLVGAFHFGQGVRGFIHLLLTFDNAGARFKSTFPELLVGALVVAAAVWILFPRTNVKEHPRVRRLTAGMIAILGGIACVEAITSLLTTVLIWPSWSVVAARLAMAVTTAGSLVVGSYFLARESGIDVPLFPQLGSRPPS